jgi:hypothetical protein
MIWFNHQIANQEMIGLYGIDDDNDINPGVAFKFTVRWSVENDTMIRRRGSLWYIYYKLKPLSKLLQF